MRLETMRNRAMHRKLDAGDAVDLSGMERTRDGDYILSGFPRDEALSEEPLDFCDSATESWIWSIGQSTAGGHVEMPDGTTRALPAGTVVASTTQKFYLAEDKGWRCVWLR